MNVICAKLILFNCVANEKKKNIVFRHEQNNVISAALRAVGNIVTGDDVQTQVVLNCSALPCLLHLLSSPRESVRKEACWTVSNITAGNPQQIQVCHISGIIVYNFIYVLLMFFVKICIYTYIFI